MLPKNLNKFSILLVLVILVNVARGQTTVEPLTTEEVQTSTVAVTKTTDNSIQTTQGDDTSPIETTTAEIECVCDCIANGNQVKIGCTTESTKESQTEASSNTERSTEAQNENTTIGVPTEGGNNKDTTTAANTGSDSTTAKSAETTNIPTTTAAAASTTMAPVACSTPAQLQPHESDCQQYYECSSEGSADGSFHLHAKSCPEKQAFNVELIRCSRDISNCLLPIQCMVKGGVADPASNSSYYLCEPRLIDLGFRVFHVDCSSNQIFYPELGKCFLDLNNIPTQDFPPLIWNPISDYDIVKAELKILKQQDKLKLKAEKDLKKAEEKLQKELEKAAKKQAKEQEKANKEKIKQEAATFVCVVEGNYPSAISESSYIACVNKKGIPKALAMQCGFGAKFDAQTGVCVNGTAVLNKSISEEEEDD